MIAEVFALNCKVEAAAGVWKLESDGHGGEIAVLRDERGSAMGYMAADAFKSCFVPTGAPMAETAEHLKCYYCKQLDNKDEIAHATIHDARGCLHTCVKHTKWRMTTSMAFGHSSDCPHAPKANRR